MSKKVPFFLAYAFKGLEKNTKMTQKFFFNLIQMGYRKTQDFMMITNS
jgi:hypothetical protein